jgi:uncharacterized protein YkwD
MKSSILLVATSALLAAASPIEKRAMTTTTVYEWETVIVTEGAPHPTLDSGKHHGRPSDKPKPKPESTYEALPPPPSVTPTPVTPTLYPTIIPTFTPQPTTVAPPPAPTTTYQAEPEPEPTSYEAEPMPTYSAAPPPPPVSSNPPVTPTPAPETPGDDMPSNALYHHNVHRANHSSPAMSWDDEIAGYAQNTANKCVFAHDMDQGRGGYGQNLAMWGTSSGAEELGDAGAIKMATTDMWYNGEFNLYNSQFYTSGPSMENFKGWGHFSQLLWAESTGLGCAVTLCPAGTMYASMPAWYMVCNYGPAGNVAGGYVENVKAPLGEAVMSA